MQKLAELYRGKAKTVYTTEDPNYLVLEFRNDTSAMDGQRIQAFDRKGMINNKFNHFIMNRLEAAGIPTQMERLLSDNEALVKRLEMIPIECVIRNRTAGSLVKRLGITENQVLNHPLFELFLKNDQLHDPIVSEAYCKAFGWASEAHLAQMKKLSYQVNDVLSKLFDDAGLILVDFKLEFGLFENKITLGDEFSPDGCRLWDKKTLEKMDKDRFRGNLGGVIEAYEQVAKRIGVPLAPFSDNVSANKKI
ncbi:Phosphoribosylaminoimidazolesuccinocarboxamide (SAICAR) synthase [Candidatus Regiella insecticola LSR1]|uniref:Phosphoribosylaminoimidazole-succinocarboxamide synthase n=1 Tax=Candidatus Regiella insecticola LSR1 TaxID=663321 RepID=E0WTF0_9ENTR|nr:phosphoribosylaminoimidazolesuccinocarboxamide synthase [Candidatus Regiella insecticola]EFL91835.1 Phosphoribosylaminoimidazolesuccinocarboxamide (SAICAR) synthase [Candidatus Regiella insecticola LSR1]